MQRKEMAAADRDAATGFVTCDCRRIAGPGRAGAATGPGARPVRLKTGRSRGGALRWR